MNIFHVANNSLEQFISNNLSSYHELRNYDFGIENRSNVSQISKYINHRIIFEYDIFEKLKYKDKKKNFTDEIIWGLYWKGYLENYKSIWIEYKNFKKPPYDSNILENAKNGTTGLDCFDTWVEELRENNYLHNHSRMWFASIWIFNFKLPWELGASFFMKHLLDGNAASNILSWRWVAGLHTNNRPYIASKENINKYTLNRFMKLPSYKSKTINKVENSNHDINKLPVQNHAHNSNFLFMFDNDLNITNRQDLFYSYSKIYIIFNGIIEHGFRLNDKVFHFKKSLIESINKLLPNSEVLNSYDLNYKLNDLKCIDVIYPGIGNNLDLINNYSKQNNINVNFIFRREDLITWSSAYSGYNKFKKFFYKSNNIKSIT